MLSRETDRGDASVQVLTERHGPSREAVPRGGRRLHESLNELNGNGQSQAGVTPGLGRYLAGAPLRPSLDRVSLPQPEQGFRKSVLHDLAVNMTGAFREDVAVVIFFVL